MCLAQFLQFLVLTEWVVYLDLSFHILFILIDFCSLYFSFWGNDSKVRGNSSRTANEEKSKIPQIDPGSVESKTAWPREENSVVTNLWFWFPLTVIALLLVTVPIRRYKRRSRINRPPQPEGDVDTDNTEENIVLREQKTPLISEGGLDAHDTRETVSSAEPRVPLRLRHELGELALLVLVFSFKGRFCIQHIIS